MYIQLQFKSNLQQWNDCYYHNCRLHDNMIVWDHIPVIESEICSMKIKCMYIISECDLIL